MLLPAVALAITSAIAPGPTSAAWAHDSIISTTPADGAHIETAPSQVSMLYTDSLITIGASVVIVDQDGTDWADGPVTLAGTDAVQPLRAGMPDGMYEVRWRVVSSDGHPISGVIPFTVGDAAPLERAPASGSPAASSVLTSDGPGVPRAVVIGALGAGIALVALLLVSLVRRAARGRHSGKASS